MPGETKPPRVRDPRVEAAAAPRPPKLHDYSGLTERQLLIMFLRWADSVADWLDRYTTLEERVNKLDADFRGLHRRLTKLEQPPPEETIAQFTAPAPPLPPMRAKQRSVEEIAEQVGNQVLEQIEEFVEEQTSPGVEPHGKQSDSERVRLTIRKEITAISNEQKAQLWDWFKSRTGTVVLTTIGAVVVFVIERFVEAALKGHP